MDYGCPNDRSSVPLLSHGRLWLSKIRIYELSGVLQWVETTNSTAQRIQKPVHTPRSLRRCRMLNSKSWLVVCVTFTHGFLLQVLSITLAFSVMIYYVCAILGQKQVQRNPTGAISETPKQEVYTNYLSAWWCQLFGAETNAVRIRRDQPRRVSCIINKTLGLSQIPSWSWWFCFNSMWQVCYSSYSKTIIYLLNYI